MRVILTWWEEDGQRGGVKKCQTPPPTPPYGDTHCYCTLYAYCTSLVVHVVIKGRMSEGEAKSVKLSKK